MCERTGTTRGRYMAVNDDGHCNHDGQLFKKIITQPFPHVCREKAAKMLHHIKHTVQNFADRHLALISKSYFQTFRDIATLNLS